MIVFFLFFLLYVLGFMQMKLFMLNSWIYNLILCTTRGSCRGWKRSFFKRMNLFLRCVCIIIMEIVECMVYLEKLKKRSSIMLIMKLIATEIIHQPLQVIRLEHVSFLWISKNVNHSICLSASIFPSTLKEAIGFYAMNKKHIFKLCHVQRISDGPNDISKTNVRCTRQLDGVQGQFWAISCS